MIRCQRRSGRDAIRKMLALIVIRVGAAACAWPVEKPVPLIAVAGSHGDLGKARAEAPRPLTHVVLPLAG